MMKKQTTNKPPILIRGRHFVFFALSLLLLMCYQCAFAGTGEDLLAGTTQAAVATFNGSIKIFIYIAEIIGAAWAFAKNKNVLILGGIVCLAFYFNVMMPKFISA